MDLRFLKPLAFVPKLATHCALRTPQKNISSLAARPFYAAPLAPPLPASFDSIEHPRWRTFRRQRGAHGDFCTARLWAGGRTGLAVLAPLPLPRDAAGASLRRAGCWGSANLARTGRGRWQPPRALPSL